MISKKFAIKVLFLSAELVPLAKVGGLGDVAGALPIALAKLGVDIRICLPFYGLIDSKKYSAKKIISNLSVSISNKNELVDVWQTFLPTTKIPVYLIKHNFFDSKEIYLNDKKHRLPRLNYKARDDKRSDNLKRFAFFTRAALEVSKKINFQPNVVHANDWHVALAADFIKTLNKKDNFFIKTKTLYTIHNLANQGITKTNIVEYAKINKNLPIIKVDAQDGDVNFMVQGILGSGLINTVSPTYAKEILMHYQDAGLDKILKKRKKDLYGILNGIDTDFFNPVTDNLIKQKYSLKNLKQKKANKLALQKQLGLPADKKIALVGLVSRLVGQKGIALFNKNFSKLNCQFVFLGTGQKKYEQQLLNLSKKFPRQFSAQIKFDEKLAHLIYAGADIFLMPSRFEPCGLGQMIAMRYGTVPVVRATGGLADTITPLKKRASGIKSTGFVFKKYLSEELYKKLNQALTVFYKQPKLWQQLQAAGMKQNFSWDKSAMEYFKLYRRLI
ncbi:glycogen synthase [Patescibacteria group bacterium]|nr:glycogen synthase [Patescibacteria group bacterium]MBU2233606.1 glycogen synthase [Patescibacteria group bacterium]MBU2264129.1 glycogen synthase [Patescibacteria group bacterium]